MGVWEFLTSGKTLHQYIDSEETQRLVATKDNCTFSYISPTMAGKDDDPFFSVDGGIAFNWRYSDNAVRIANSKFYCGSDLPGLSENTDDYWGLGNEYCWSETGSCWFDVGMTRCAQCMSQGTDRNTDGCSGDNPNDGLLGQYAVYVSEVGGYFPCEDELLSPTLSPSPTPPASPTLRPAVSPTLSPSAPATAVIHRKSEFNISFGLLELLLALIAILLCFILSILLSFWMFKRGPCNRRNADQSIVELKQIARSQRSFHGKIEGNDQAERDQGILANSPLAKHTFMLNDIEMFSSEGLQCFETIPTTI